jgi:hypothetical protein
MNFIAIALMVPTLGLLTSLDILLPIYGIIAIHAWYLARQIPDL